MTLTHTSYCSLYAVMDPYFDLFMGSNDAFLDSFKRSMSTLSLLTWNSNSSVLRWHCKHITTSPNDSGLCIQKTKGSHKSWLGKCSNMYKLTQMEPPQCLHRQWKGILLTNSHDSSHHFILSLCNITNIHSLKTKLKTSMVSYRGGDG